MAGAMDYAAQRMDQGRSRPDSVLEVICAALEVPLKRSQRGSLLSMKAPRKALRGRPKDPRGKREPRFVEILHSF
jgi:hypothetical protein